MILARRNLVARGELDQRDDPLDRTKPARKRLAEIARRWAAVPADVRAANLRADPDAFFRLQRDALYAAGLLDRAEALSKYMTLEPEDRRALVEVECLAIANPPVVVASEVDAAPAAPAAGRRRRAP